MNTITLLWEAMDWTQIVIVFVPVIIVLLVLFSVSRQYVRCPANRILVVTGPRGPGKPNEVQCLHGGTTFVVPLLQDRDYLSLDPIEFDADTSPVLTKEREVRVAVGSSWTVGISTEPAAMKRAATRLLGLDDDAIREQCRGLADSAIRQVTGRFTDAELDSDRERYWDAVRQQAQDELAKIGVDVVRSDIVDLRSIDPPTT